MFLYALYGSNLSSYKVTADGGCTVTKIIYHFLCVPPYIYIKRAAQMDSPLSFD
jgi:hypothetical protein